MAISAVGGAANRIFFIPGKGSVRLKKGMKGFACSGYSISSGFDGQYCGSDISSFYTPHFPYYIGSAAMAYELSWTSSIGAVARFNVRSGTGNLTGYDWLDLRIGNDPDKPPARFDLVITDNRGNNATLPLNLTTIDGWPGTGSLDRMQARTLRGRLTQSKLLRGLVDIARMKSVSLVTRTLSGSVWLLDIATSKRQIVKPTVLNLPVVFVSIDNIVQKKGDGGTALVKVKIVPTPTKFQINITANSSSVLHTFPVRWTGNTIHDLD